MKGSAREPALTRPGERELALEYSRVVCFLLSRLVGTRKKSVKRYERIRTDERGIGGGQGSTKTEGRGLLEIYY